MPAVVLPPRPAQTLTSPSGDWCEVGAQAQGDTGRQLREQAARVYEQWMQRGEVLLAMVENSDEFSYVSVPPNRTFYVKTRYVFTGKGEPLPFDLDDR